MIQFNLQKTVLLLCATLAGLAACSRSTDDAGSVLVQNEGVLKYVPADTAYVFATPAPMPDDVLDKLEANADSIYSAYETVIKSTLSELAAAEEGAGRGREFNKYLALAGEIVGLMRSDRLRAAGVPRSPQMAIYGMGLIPVLRVALADTEAFEATLDELEAKSGEKMLVAELDGRPYRYVGDDSARLIVAIIDDYVVATLVPTALSDAQLMTVLGLTPPRQSIAESGDLAAIASRYEFADYALGFIDVERVAATFLDSPSGVNAELLAAFEYDAGALSDVCRREIRAMTKVMPRVVSGYTDISTERLGSNTIFELRSDLAAGLAALATPVPGLGVDHGGLGSFGMSLDLMAAREFYEARLDAMEADPYECEHFADLQAGVAQGRQALSQPLPPIVYGFKGFLAVVDDVEGIDFASRQPPTNVNARILVANENAEGLLAMGAMFSPEIAALELEPDGKPVPLNLPQLTAQFEAAYVAMTETALAIAIGETSGDRLSDLFASSAAEPPPFVSMHLDGGRYYQMMSEAIAAGSTASADAEPVSPELKKAMSQVMTGIGEMIDRVSIDVRFTEHGVELPATLTLFD